MAHYPARSRDRQRRLRRGGKSRRLRRQARERRSRAGILGKFLRRRPFWPASRRGFARQRRDPRRRVRPRKKRRYSSQLALPTRPPHRRLRPYSQSLARRLIACRESERELSLPSKLPPSSATGCPPNGNITTRRG